MKKLIALAAAGILALTALSGCSGKTENAGNAASMKDGESVQTVVEKIVDAVGMQMPADVDNEVLKSMFYIDSENDAEEAYGKMAMTMTSADNVVAVKAKPDKKAAVVDGLNKRLKDVQDSFAQYLPDQSEKAKKGQVIEKGDYVFLLILGNEPETFDADMSKAKEIIDAAF